LAVGTRRRQSMYCDEWNSATMIYRQTLGTLLVLGVPQRPISQ
jgi:hypothetical protein